eukprot:maker-scaffold6_size1037037-snap-gene-9.0 protein:Tk01303 transcript:maker-scaffold6_size1037037-snap-gene-9.0-mRNA-1 annotation:"choline sulfatase"
MGDLGAHGNPYIKTPHLDDFYKRSVRFTNFHVATTCAPSRGAIMTGRHTNRLNVFHTISGRSLLYEDEVILPQVLAQHGYTNDDQTFESIQALGFDEVQTPNLDRLVNNGTSFTHAYNMGGWNGAICVASRAMIISGSYIWNAKEKAALWAKGDSTALNQTWGKLLQNQGYDTYMTGKWHVDAPAETVFNDARNKQESNSKRPNIVFIMSDDHAYQAISAYGHQLNKTPNIDRIAQNGALFTNSFVTNSICAPSRAAMLTGKHSFVNDDLSATAVSCYENTQSKTPNIDALAAQGTRYTHTYTQYPVCGPSRASLLFGYYPSATKTYGYVSGREAVGSARKSLPEFFKDNGYYTAR